MKIEWINQTIKFNQKNIELNRKNEKKINKYVKKPIHK